MTTKLDNIPFLDLGVRFDSERMKSEIDSLSEFKSYKSLYTNDDFAGWTGISLTSQDGNQYSGLSEERTSVRVYTTEAGEKCPYILECIKSISPLTIDWLKIRVMKLGSSQSIKWHSHSDHGQQKNIITLQLPVTMPRDFIYAITPRWNISVIENKSVLKNPYLVYTTKLNPGRVSFFNSYHFHNVFNYSNEDRYTVMFYGTTSDEVLSKYINESLDNYTGPYID